MSSQASIGSEEPTFSSHFNAKSFYSTKGKYLNPLERKKLNQMEMIHSNSVTKPLKPIKKSLKRIKKTKVAAKRVAKLPSKSKEIYLLKRKFSSPRKEVHRKFFSKKSPSKPSTSLSMNLGFGGNLEIQYANLRRSPRKKFSKTESSKIENLDLVNDPIKSVCDKISNLRHSPRKKASNLDLFQGNLFNEDFPIQDENTNLVADAKKKKDSDEESGFSENSSNSTDSPIKKEFKRGLEKGFHSPLSEKNTNSLNSPKSSKKRRCGFEQLTIDAGQKDFGAIRCQTCNMVFTSHDPVDEIAHSKFHNKFLNTLKFPGWKKEDMISDCFDGRIIRVLPNGPKHQAQKVEELRQLIDTELGFPNVGLVNPKETHFFLFISSSLKKIVGCIIAEPISKAYRVFQDSEVKESKVWCRDEVPVSAICGISRIWVLPNHRRKKIASRLLNSIMLNFTYGRVLSKDQVAFSDPTPTGREFISVYTGTNSFLVYGGYDRRTFS